MDAQIALALRFALQLSLKATALFLVTALLVLACRRASAATRHRWGALGLAGAAALPLLSLAAPVWDLRVLPAPLASWDRGPRAQARQSAPPAAPTPSVAVSGGARVAIGTVPSSPDRVRGAAAPSAVTAAAPRAGAHSAGSPAEAADAASPAREHGSRFAGSFLNLALASLLLVGSAGAVWLLGALLLLGRLGLGLWRVRRAALTARPAEESWSPMLGEASSALALRRPVRLLVSDRLPVAITSGSADPLVLLPAEAAGWTPQRQRVVLLHELAHVVRNDWIWLLASEVALSLWWFHPLAWWLHRGVRRDAEQAADDLVLEAGTRPSDYAAHLLDLVRALRGEQGPAVAMAMARSAGIESRLRAILDPARRRRAPGTLLRGASLLGLVALAGLLAAARPTSASPARAATVERASGELEEAAAGNGPAVARAFRLRDELKRAGFEVGRALEGALAGNRSWSWSSSRGRGWYSRGMELHQREKYQQAIEAFQKAIEQDDRVPEATYNIACAHALLGEVDKAVEWLKKAQDEGFDAIAHADGDSDFDDVRVDPKFRAARKELRAARRQANHGESRALLRRFERLQQRNPKEAAPWYQAGKDLLRADEYDAAVKAFQASAERSQSPGASIYNAACALSLKGDPKGALDLLEKAIAAGFDDVGLLRRDSDLEEVRDQPRFRELVTMAKELSFPSAGGGWSFGLFRSNRKRDARDELPRLQEAAKKYPKLGRPFFNLGYAYLAANEPKKAEEAFGEALTRGYRKGTTLYNLACAAARQDKKDAAFDALKKSADAGFSVGDHLRGDDDLRGLHGDPRWRELMRGARELAREDEGDEGGDHESEEDGDE